MDLMAGFELAIIMDLTGGLAAVATRTLANVIVIYSNPVLDQQWLIQNVLKPGHDCKNIMDWTSTKTKIPSSIESLIGNMYNLEFYHSFLVWQPIGQKVIFAFNEWDTNMFYPVFNKS